MISYISNNKTEKRLRILIVKLFGDLYDGVYNYIYNLISKTVFNDIQFDLFISAGDISKNFIYPKFKELGVNIFIASEIRNKHSYRKDINSLKCLLKKYEYNSIYINSGHILFTAITVYLANRNKIKNIITHSHNSITEEIEKVSFIKKLVFKNSRKIITKNVKYMLACSKIAGDWLYGKTIMDRCGTIIKNGIDIKKYSFNNDLRKKIRTELGIKENTLIIGLTASFTYQKNHSFLLLIFSEIKKRYKNSKLLLIGDGERRNFITKQAEDLELNNDTIFLGAVQNSNEFYNAMDVFVMPSLHEGLPYVGIEAQASCIPCFFSDVITKELNITDYANFLSLNLSASKWADIILQNIDSDIMKKRVNNSKIVESKIAKAGFDLTQTVAYVTELMLK